MTMNVDEKEMLESLSRSGYLLESEIAEMLADSNYFVRSGHVVEDPITGKGRDIDIIANFNGGRARRRKGTIRSSSRIEYVFEIKNNLFPVVLLTDFRDNPYIESWTGLKEAVNRPDGIKYDDFHEHYFEKIIENSSNIFTQYCSFHKKKANDELMASHPDRFHESLSKIIQYCDEQVESCDTYLWNETPKGRSDRFFRHLLYVPILLVSDNLYQLKNNSLEKVESSILVVNYYHSGEPKMAYVFVMTKAGLPKFMDSMRNLEKNVEEIMAKVVDEDA